MSGGRSRISTVAGGTIVPPSTVKNTNGWIGEIVEKASRHIETAVRAARALIHNGSLGGLATV